MVQLCSKLEKDVADIDGVNAGLETRGAGLISRASELHARLDSCGARALEQVSWRCSLAATSPSIIMFLHTHSPW